VLIKEYYREGGRDAGAKAAAIEACRDQISIAPIVAAEMRAEFPGPLPSHVGYEQLAVMLEQDALYSEAIEICQQARAAVWSGEWDKRIARCEQRAQRAAMKAKPKPARRRL
jgi:hypothetical protein